MSGVILYYTVSPIHFRNLELIAQEMPEWTFRTTYQLGNRFLTNDTMAKLPFDSVPFEEDHVPDALWSGDVKALVFSTAQAHQGPITLLREALLRDVPTIAIEESNQIALNNGTVNNYLLPVDHLLVASSHEREGMIQAGVPEGRVQVTGWPFYAGQAGKTPPDRLREMKRHFGLDPDRPVATLTLTGLHDAGESPAMRRRQLTLAAQGLPPEYQLVVKPHPIEKLRELMPFVSECAPRATVIEGMVNIDDLLQATDVLLNRGTSQVCIEALFRHVPVIVLDTGVKTPFHGLAQDLIVEIPEDIPAALARLSVEKDPLRAYDAFSQAHVPYPPQQARALTCGRIGEIAANGTKDPDRSDQWFDLALYQGLQGHRPLTLEMLSKAPSQDANHPTGALRALSELRATREDLDTLKEYVGSGFRPHVLRCLWIDQLDQRREAPKKSDIEWMQDFPPTTNPTWLREHTGRWVDVLGRSGYSQAVTVLAQRLEKDFTHIAGFADLVRYAERYDGLFGQAKYQFRVNRRRVRRGLATIKRSLISRFA